MTECPEMMFVLRQLCEKNTRPCQKVYTFAIDRQNSFDTVEWYGKSGRESQRNW